MIDKFVKFLKNNSRIIYFIYLYFMLSLVFSNQFDFDLKSEGIESTIWSVQAGVSILAITMIAITMGYNDTRIYGMTVREIVFSRKTTEKCLEKDGDSDVRSAIIEKIQDSVIVIMGLSIIKDISVKNPLYVGIIVMILTLQCFFIYLGLKHYKYNDKGYSCFVLVSFIYTMNLLGIGNDILHWLIIIILIKEIVQHRCEITYYERIITAILFVGMCGFFVVTDKKEGVITIAVLSLINILYLTYYSVEYIMNYENMKNGHRENILEIFKRDIQFENEVIANE